MSQQPTIVHAVVFEDGDAYVLARITKKDASHNKVAIVPADVSTVSRKVLLVSDGSTIIGPTPLTVANVVLSALSTGTIWEVDTTGFNFIDLVPATAYPTGEAEVAVEYKFTLTGGEVFWIVARCTPLPVLTS